MKKNRIMLLVLAVVFIIFLAKDVIIKIAVENGVGSVTGLKLRTGSFRVGIFRPVVDIKNLRLLNPANFPDKTMIDMPEIYVKYNLPAIIGGKVYLPEVRLALKEFIVEKNSKGELNLDALKNVKEQKKTKPAEPAKKSAKAPQIKIDLFKLNIGKVIYKDYSKGAEPQIKEFNINLDESFSNIDNPYVLANLIIVKALMNTTVSSLTGFDLKGLQGSVNEAISGAKEAASAAASNVKETTSTAVSQIKDTEKQAAGTLKELFKNPFGSKK